MELITTMFVFFNNLKFHVLQSSQVKIKKLPDDCRIVEHVAIYLYVAIYIYIYIYTIYIYTIYIYIYILYNFNIL